MTETPTAETTTAEDGVELVLSGVSRAQTNDLRCGRPDDAVRICRALFVVSTIDPVLHLHDPELFQRVVDAVLWSLDDALTVSPAEIEEALTALIAETRQLQAASNDAERATVLEARSHPTITEPLDSHWDDQCR